MSEAAGNGGRVPWRGRDPGGERAHGGYDPPGGEPDVSGQAQAQDRHDDRHDDREARPGQAHGKGSHGRKAHGREPGEHGAKDHRPRDAQAPERGPAAQEAGEESLADLRARVEELQSEVSDLRDRWRRALADLDNLRKRVSRDAGRTRDEERARAAAEWLPVLDNLDRALEHAETDPVSIVDGMRAIRDQAQDVLSRLGYARRDDTGAVFDPARHEAVGVLPKEGVPEGTIVQVVRPGYGDGEQLLRPALVVVAKGA